MATLGVIQTTVSATVSTNNTTFTEVVESSALTSGKTYYVICHALTEGGLTSKPDSFRLVNRTVLGGTLSNSTMIREPNTAGATQSYYYLGQVTAGESGGGLAFEQKSSNAGFTVSTQYLSMLILDLSNLTSDDFFFENDIDDVALTSTFQDFATTTVTTNKEDDWLVLGWQATDTDVVNGYSTVVQLYSDADSDYPESQMEGEDLTEVLNVLQGRSYSANDAQTTWSIKSKMHTGGATDSNNHLESTLLGFRLSVFEAFEKEFTSAESTTTATDFQQYARISFDPDSSEDVIVFGSSLFHAGATSRPALSVIQLDGTTSPNTQPDTEYGCVSNDGADILPLSYITKYTPDGSSIQIDLDCKKTTAEDIGFSKRALVAFTTKIASPINYSAVATQTFASGDVASQSYNSGDVASETFSSGDVASEVNPS